MAKEERTNKHPDWRLSTRERFNYYLSDSGRLFGTSVFQTYMTSFLALRGVNLALLAGVLLVLKIIDAVDDVVFGYLIDKLKITEWKALR
ncbi:MAG: MFS transporter, partial [Oscillospiraceae bacterium]|nr:MFS transporter [Oscillospiraceae bacterium]